MFHFQAFLFLAVTIQLILSLQLLHRPIRTKVTRFAVKNDAEARSNREIRRPGANDRIIELRKPLGLELDEDSEGNVFVKSVDANGRAAKSGMVFVGDYVKMVSATFGNDMWSCRGAGLTRVLSCINVRNTQPVKLVLEASDPQEELKRREIAFREPSPEEKAKKVAVSISYN
jgi:hypothetical protein